MNNTGNGTNAAQARPQPPPRPTSRPFDVEPIREPVSKAPAKPIPDNYPRVVPYLCIDGASAAIAFYHTAFGATERMRIAEPDGRIGHAELEIGTAVIMLSDEFPELGIRAPKTIGGTPVTLTLYVENVDDVFARAVAAGATVLRPLTNQFYGDRTATFEDPFGHRWSVATHIEDVSATEMVKRAAATRSGS